MELSEFLKTRYKFPPLPADYTENARWEEETMFEAWIRKYPESDHADIMERMQYIREYVLKYPDFDGEEWFPSQTALNHYDFRLDKLKNTNLSENEFYYFDILQEAITDWKTQVLMPPEAKFV